MESTTPASPEAEPPPDADGGPDWDVLAQSVVSVGAWGDGTSCDEGQGGSGSVVGDGSLVLTNHHVVYADNGTLCPDIDVAFAGTFRDDPSGWVKAEIIGSDRHRDIAVLRIIDPGSMPARGVRPVRISTRDLSLGETVTVLGYPEDGGWTVTLTQGVVSGTWSDPETGHEYVKTDADISPGNSGGAAFDRSGAFVGIPTAGVEEVGLLIPADEAEQYLSKWAPGG